MGFASNIREKVNRPSTATLFSNNLPSRIGRQIAHSKADIDGKNHHSNDIDYTDCLFSSRTIQEKSKIKSKYLDNSEKQKQLSSLSNDKFSGKFHDSSMQHNVTEKLFNNWTGMEDRIEINRNRNFGENNHYNRPDMRRPWTTHSMAIPHTNLSLSPKDHSLGKERSFQRSCDVTKDAEFLQLSRTLFESNKMNSAANFRVKMSGGNVSQESKYVIEDRDQYEKSNGMNQDVQCRHGDYQTILMHCNVELLLFFLLVVVTVLSVL